MWLPKRPFPPVIKYDSGIACKDSGAAQGVAIFC